MSASLSTMGQGQTQARTVLMIAPRWPPVNTVGTRRAVRLADRLPEHGWRAVVITPDPAGGADYDLPPLSSELHEPGVPVHRVSGAQPLIRTRRLIERWLGDRPSFSEIRRTLQRAISGTLTPDHLTEWAPAAARAARRIARRQAIDLVWVSAPPFGNAVVGTLVAKALGVPCVVDFRDPWTQAPIVGRQPHRVRARVIEEIEAMVMRSAAAVSYVYQANLEWNRERFGKPRDASWVAIPNGFDPADFPADAVPRTFSRPTLVYAGSLHGGRSMRPIFRAMSRLVEEGRPTPNLIIHSRLQPADADALELAERLHDLVEVNGYIPFAQLAPKLLGAAANLVLTAPEHPHAVYVKVFDSFITGKPTLEYGPAGSVNAQTIAETGTGRSVSFEEGEDTLADALEQVANGELPYQPNAATIDEWTADKMVQRTAALFDRVMRTASDASEHRHV